MKHLSPEEVALLSNFTMTLKNGEEAARVYSRVKGPVQPTPGFKFYSPDYRVRLYWASSGAAACALTSHFRELGDRSEIFHDMLCASGSYVVWRGDRPTRVCGIPF